MQKRIQAVITLAFLTSQVSAKASSHRIVVDLSEQHLSVFDAQNRTVFSSAVITGSARHPTPIGNFRIKTLESDRDKKKFVFPQGAHGEVYASNVWAVFYRDKYQSGYGIHDANWWPGWKESQAYALRIHKSGFGSHGCVNVPDSMIWKLLPYLNKGTSVTIQD